jgi:HEPN domain-containing protein
MQADGDYISARANYQMRLRQQFLWSALQAVEKYLKAILLFSGKSSRYYYDSAAKRKPFMHNLDALYAEVKKITPLRFDIDPKGEEFLTYLHKQGNNRYISTSAYMERDAIHQLDALVWEIRRYCQYIPDRESGSQTVTPNMYESFIQGITKPSHKKNPQLFRLIEGNRDHLQNVIEREPRDQARKALVWMNICYGKKSRRQLTHDSHSSVEIPPNEREWPGVDWKIIQDYVQIKIP